MDQRFCRLALLIVAHLTILGCETAPEESVLSDVGMASDVTTGHVDVGPDSMVDGGTVQASDCVPAEREFAETIKPILEARCGQCHGETLQYGAVHQLVSYEDLLKPLEDGTVADLVGTVVGGGLMPPAGQPAMGSVDRQALVSWAH